MEDEDGEGQDNVCIGGWKNDGGAIIDMWVMGCLVSAGTGGGAVVHLVVHSGGGVLVVVVVVVDVV